MWLQKRVRLQAKQRGFHLVTHELVAQLPELSQFRVGIAHLFIQHTSASLTINENADPDVRRDMESHFNHFVPENQPYYFHTLEGSDDMPAHIKASTIGASISVPISNGRLALGTWQGIYLGEHRDHGGSRQVVITLHGDAA
ncbi:secondary thiamine-phosphate synthase enzyme [Mariprofundus ferrinatatus]|uniref:Secondary thiamine-phosphate synthase enzyme n=1 Tax=Mariprofundus ferrinatatus TaxID=1921087 RepID=A0A2K8L4N6_9PROT|nr:secondary thiamine-phosphate synthase enzyme YjbQ [Mariprofundus ferrinatatus]ATX82247.1 secondary thiamine-phosphate synthase enzyme [Mariprofundus ferrinatatus]